MIDQFKTFASWLQDTLAHPPFSYDTVNRPELTLRQLRYGTEITISVYVTDEFQNSYEGDSVGVGTISFEYVSEDAIAWTTFFNKAYSHFYTQTKTREQRELGYTLHKIGTIIEADNKGQLASANVKAFMDKLIGIRDQYVGLLEAPRTTASDLGDGVPF